MLELVEKLKTDVAHDLAFDARPVTAAPERGERRDDGAGSQEAEHRQQATAVGGLKRVVNQVPEGERVIDLFFVSPTSERESVRYMIVARNFALDQPPDKLIKFTEGIWEEDRVLIERGLRARKGAPETFDVLGLLHMLDRLKRNQEDEIAVPVFDRDLEISRAGARVTSTMRLLP